MGNQEKDSTKLVRGLNNRHIQFIAIGGAIGTGLFMGAGKTIHLAGPSIILVYCIIGFFMFCMLRALGELLLSNLEYKSFTDFCEDLIGPWAGFFMGWTYWFCFIVCGTADLMAIASYVHYWFPDTPLWIPAISFALLLMCLNLVAVSLFGELEFWFSSIKVVAILTLIGLGIFMIATGFTSPSGTVTKVANLWEHDGFFPKGLFGFYAGFQIAIYSFVGIELLGTTAAETKSPEATLPRAINTVPIRIVLFYICSLVVIMCITPWNTIDPEMSPFVTVFNLIGISAAAGLVNFIILTAAASSTNSGIYSTSRMLFGLAHLGVAPKIFKKLSRHHVPANALMFSCLVLLAGGMLLIFTPSIMTAFTLMTTLASVLFIFVWSMILFAYLKYMQKKPELHQASKFKMPGGRFTAIATLIFFAFALVLMLLEEDTRSMLVVSPIWFILLGIAYKITSKRVSQ